MDLDLPRLKNLLSTTRNAAMATVNDDNSPHNTPFYLMHDEDLAHIYWASRADTQHSHNILRTGQAFVTVFDAIEAKKGGLYFKLERGYSLADDELRKGVEIQNNFRARDGRPSVSAEFYMDGPQKMYRADIVQIWYLVTEFDASGEYKREYRQGINASDLLA
jgi:Pyridoxamine 5'-phosphate oxidase